VAANCRTVGRFVGRGRQRGTIFTIPVAQEVSWALATSATQSFSPMRHCCGRKRPGFRVVSRGFSISRRSGTSPSYGGRSVSAGVIRFRQ
jgi:hypothetical protein